MSRTTERVRHELRFRIAKVVSNERLTPLMARITLSDPDFATFRSDAYDDHVKLFFAKPGETLERPVPGPDGLAFPGGIRPEGRDYTPRSFDIQTGEVVIDFVLHGDGPAASWAATAKPGDTLGVGGPRGSFVVRGAYDWYLLAGDETALPAIGRRIEELPAGADVIAIIEIADASEKQSFATAANLDLRWVVRSEGGKLVEAVRETALPQGTGYAFVAGEASASAAIREHLLGAGVNPDYLKVANYWRRGEADHDDGHAH
ncbi:MAG: siderophore-interacting protein [Hyphomicrobiales bacterium]|nr:MAG: siderophore-interacting protein [Hyphomicrobiales bacterium]